ncbi:hypothetical protein [Brevibacillus brevis]|uniref:hypothetical protein n=1 Tax=Brevibacillus brevis TaxID=1393 RepID=UPI0011594D7B|nr:hypothetical protein [Lysinibacillus sp. SDF0063]TQR29418.1 hypothetical protein C7Y45_28890 [Lysinibacillus sp. SDF0063]
MKQAFTARTTGEQGVLEWFGLGETVAIGQLIEVIRAHHQLDIYTVGEHWCVQLFDPNVDANDGVSCISEGSSTELVNALYDALEWIYDCLTDK